MPYYILGTATSLAALFFLRLITIKSDLGGYTKLLFSLGVNSLFAYTFGNISLLLFGSYFRSADPVVFSLSFIVIVWIATILISNKTVTNAILKWTPVLRQPLKIERQSEKGRR